MATTSAMFSNTVLVIKSLIGEEMTKIDKVLAVVNAVVLMGSSLVNAALEAASIYDKFKGQSKGAEVKGTGNNQTITGTSYNSKELYKTQPDAISNRGTIDYIKEDIINKGPNSIEPIPVRVHNGQALIVDGHHRYQAFVELGYDRVPIKYISESQIANYGRTLEQLLSMMFN